MNDITKIVDHVSDVSSLISKIMNDKASEMEKINYNNLLLLINDYNKSKAKAQFLNFNFLSDNEDEEIYCMNSEDENEEEESQYDNFENIFFKRNFVHDDKSEENVSVDSNVSKLNDEESIDGGDTGFKENEISQELSDSFKESMNIVLKIQDKDSDAQESKEDNKLNYIVKN